MSAFLTGSPSPASPVLDEDEARVARARHLLTKLGTALVRDPLDRRVHSALRTFMETDSEPALRSWDVIVQRTPEELRARICAVLSAGTKRRAL